MLALLALAGCDQSGERDPRIKDPPGRYQNRNATVTLEIVDIGQTARRCAELGARPGPNHTSEGCHAQTRFGAMAFDVVVMPRPSQMSPVRWVQLFVHELGHVLGWPGDHPPS